MWRRKDLVTLFLALALAGCVELADNAPTDPRAARDVAAVYLDPAAATAALNAYRASQGLGAVRLDPALNEMAQRQADAMATSNQMSHDVAGSFPSRLAASGVHHAQLSGVPVGFGGRSRQHAVAGEQVVDLAGHLDAAA